MDKHTRIASGVLAGHGSVTEDLRQLFNDRSFAPRNTRFELIVALLIVVSCVLYILRTYDLPPLLHALVYGAETVIILLFTIEYACRAYFARSRSAFVRSWYGVTDALTILPFWLGMFFPYFYAFEYLRALRLFKWNAYFNRYLDRPDIDLTFASRIAIVRLVVPIAVVIFISAALLLEFERAYNPKITDFGHALYLAVTTVSTVGYGDVTPVTAPGRLVAMVTMLLSFGLIPVFIAYSLRLYYQYAGKAIAPCTKCGLRFHDFNARFCKICGQDLPVIGARGAADIL